MTKKKRSNQNSNSAIGDSSESESSKDSSKVSEANKTSCSHINKSSDISLLRKNIKSNKEKNLHLTCSLCKKNEDTVHPKDGWVCLRCAAYSCGFDGANHRIDHFKVARSNAHYLALQINSNIIWCFQCEKEIPIDANKRLQNCADFVKKQYTDRSTLFTISTQEMVDSKRVNGECTKYLKPDSLPCQPLLNGLSDKEVTKPALHLPKVRGLTNLGNTCFFNSVLQCLAQTPGLVPLLKEMDNPGETFHLELDATVIDAVLEKHKKSELSETLADILTEISSCGGGGGDEGKGYAVNPRRLLKALSSQCPQFEDGDQHDAHELLRHLLDSVYKEDLKRYQKAILNHIGYKKMAELDEEKKNVAKKLNQKVCDTIPIRPDHIFKGSLVSILQCDVCRHKSKREETFLDLSLPVAQEKAQPPVRSKKYCISPEEEKINNEVTVSNHERKIERAHRKTRRHREKSDLRQKKCVIQLPTEESQGKPPSTEGINKDSISGDQTDADIEDNEDNFCEEQDHKTEIVESGYSSEKQMSARGSPVTNQEDDKPMSDMSADLRAESGLGSIQELTVTIPEEANPDCTSQDSVRVNASRGSPDISSDSQQGNLRKVDLSSDYQLPAGDRRSLVYDWNCSGAGQDSSSASLSVSPHGESENMSVCTSLPNSNDNMSVCDSLPENMSLMLNSPIKNQNLSIDENSGEEPYRMDSQDNEIQSLLRSSPLDPVETELSESLKENCKVAEEINSRLMLKCSPFELGETTELNFKGERLHYTTNVNSLSNSCRSVDNVHIDSGSSDDISGCHKEVDSLKFENSLKQYNSPIPLGDSLHFTGEFPLNDNSKHRSSPVETSELEPDVLKLSLQRMNCLVEDKNRTSPVLSAPLEDNNELATVATMSPIPLPPPLPMFTSSYSFTQTQPVMPKYDNTYSKYKIEEGECSLQSCLNQFTKIEMLTGNNKVGCEACTEKVNKGNKDGKTVYQNSSKQLLICKLPPIMIFHLKRFQVQKCSFRKITRHVNFPLVVDVSPFCFEELRTEGNGPILYSLYGVVEHMGTLHSGHYVAYVKVRSHTEKRHGDIPLGKWYYVSDSHVRSVEESDVLQAQAYLLFYERIL